MYLHVIEDPTRYNGWTNWETWNAALWVLNTEEICTIASGYARNTDNPTWDDFIRYEGFESFTTPDGVAFADPKLDTDELDELIQEINA